MKLRFMMGLVLLLNTVCYSQSKVKILTCEFNSNDCKNWAIRPDSVGVIIANMTPLSGPRHHCCYHNYACALTGNLMYNGKQYKYILNAGGWAEIYTTGTRHRFMLACTVERFFKYFLSAYDPKGVSGD